MKALNKIMFTLILLMSINAMAQTTETIDRFSIPNKNFDLIKHVRTDGSKYYEIRSYFWDFDNKWTLDIDTSNFGCGEVKSLFFVTPQVGFVTESGGCYAYFDRLHRTTDGGKTWTLVHENNPIYHFGTLAKHNFFMFNENDGIIIYEINEQKLMVALTHDGGIVWDKKDIPIDVDSNISSIGDIWFSNQGQIVLILKYYEFGPLKDKQAVVVQSTDYGKKFSILHS